MDIGAAELSCVPPIYPASLIFNMYFWVHSFAEPAEINWLHSRWAHQNAQHNGSKWSAPVETDSFVFLIDSFITCRARLLWHLVHRQLAFVGRFNSVEPHVYLFRDAIRHCDVCTLRFFVLIKLALQWQAIQNVQIPWMDEWNEWLVYIQRERGGMNERL